MFCIPLFRLHLNFSFYCLKARSWAKHEGKILVELLILCTNMSLTGIVWLRVIYLLILIMLCFGCLPLCASHTINSQYTKKNASLIASKYSPAKPNLCMSSFFFSCQDLPLIIHILLCAHKYQTIKYMVHAISYSHLYAREAITVYKKLLVIWNVTDL